MSASSNQAARRNTRPEAVVIFLLLIVYVLTLSGCFSFHNSAASGPDTPKALKVNKTTNLKVLSEIENFYYGRCLQDKTSLPPSPQALPMFCGTPRTQRDTIIYDLKIIIDSNYDAYARHFQQTADTASFVGEVGAASLTAVGTLVGATELKDVL